MVSEVWGKFKWAFGHLSWLLAGLVVIINPDQIDKLAANHPHYSELILALWGMLMLWANKPRAAPGMEPQTDKLGNPKRLP